MAILLSVWELIWHPNVPAPWARRVPVNHMQDSDTLAFASTVVPRIPAPYGDKCHNHLRRIQCLEDHIGCGMSAIDLENLHYFERSDRGFKLKRTVCSRSWRLNSL